MRLQRIGHGAVRAQKGPGQREAATQKRAVAPGRLLALASCAAAAVLGVFEGHDRTRRVIRCDGPPGSAATRQHCLAASGAPLRCRPTVRRPPCERFSLALAACVLRSVQRAVAVPTAGQKRTATRMTAATVGHGRIAPRDHRSECTRDAVFQVRKGRLFRCSSSSSSSLPLASSAVTCPRGKRSPDAVLRRGGPSDHSERSAWGEERRPRSQSRLMELPLRGDSFFFFLSLRRVRTPAGSVHCGRTPTLRTIGGETAERQR